MIDSSGGGVGNDDNDADVGKDKYSDNDDE